MHYTKGRQFSSASSADSARWPRWAPGARWVLWVGVLVIGVPVADAQIGPGGGGGLNPGMGGPTQPAGEDKKEGVAEAAPKTPGLLPTTPALPAPKGRRKRWKLLELDGYYRMRTDWFKN